MAKQHSKFNYHPESAGGGGSSSSGRTITGSSGAMSDSDDVVQINHAGTVAIAGAAARTAWKRYTIKDISGLAGSNPITYTPNSGTIDGAATLLIQQGYDSVTIYSDGTNEYTV